MASDFCANIRSCFAINANYGVRITGNQMNNVSIQDPAYFGRLIIDLIFVIIVVFALVNIVMGIVIDSFGELYDKNNEIQDDINNVCFICEYKREDLEKRGISFDLHIS